MKTLATHPLLRRGFAALALCMCGTLAGAAQAEWTQDAYAPGKTYANTGESTLTGDNAAQLVPKWERALGQFYASAATQAGGRVFVCSNLHGVSAQEAGSGHILWSQPGQGVDNCGVPALSSDVAYLFSSDLLDELNVLSAVDQASGDVLWTVNLPAGSKYLTLGYGTTLAGDRLYISTDRRAVLALSTVDGSLAWQASTGGGSVFNNDVAVAGGRAFVSTWHACCGDGVRKLFAFDAATGAALWVRGTEASNMQFPAMALGERVFVSNDNGKVYAFRAADGKRLWQRQLDGWVSDHLVGQGQVVYAISGNGTVQALDAKTGATQWSRVIDAGLRISSNMVWANGLLYFTTEDVFNQRRLVVLNDRSGRRVASLPVPAPGSYIQLSVSDGRVLLSSNGTVISLGL